MVIFIGLKSNHSLALSVTESLNTRFAQIVGFVKVVRLISLKMLDLSKVIYGFL